MGVKIRDARIQDLESIQNLNQELFLWDFKFDNTLDINWPGENREYFKNSIISSRSSVFIAEIRGKIVGYLIGSIGEPEDYRKVGKIGEIDNMFILERERGKGIGKMLINKFIQSLKKEGIKRLKVVASASNKDTIKFYKKIFFKDYDLVLERDL